MNDAAEVKTKKSDFFTYKGYYGNRYDSYVIMMQIIEKTKVGNLDVASKVRIYKMATDEKLNPVEAIVKQSEKSSLYEALDIAYIWLTR